MEALGALWFSQCRNGFRRGGAGQEAAAIRIPRHRCCGRRHAPRPWVIFAMLFGARAPRLARERRAVPAAARRRRANAIYAAAHMLRGDSNCASSARGFGHCAQAITPARSRHFSEHSSSGVGWRLTRPHKPTRPCSVARRQSRLGYADLHKRHASRRSLQPRRVRRGGWRAAVRPALIKAARLSGVVRRAVVLAMQKLVSSWRSGPGSGGHSYF